MRIVQIILPEASQYERKSQRVDLEVLDPIHEVVVVHSVEEARGTGAQVAHIYATGELPARELVKFPIPYVSSVDVRRSRWPWRRAAEPEYVLSPMENLPEAVESRYFEEIGLRTPRSPHVVASFSRDATVNMIEQTMARIHRFRDDVEWRVLDEPPAPEDLTGVDVWVDPAVSEEDLDGFVAEALVAGLPVVAARTQINSTRLEKGRTGALVPAGDPNEMTHAILAALFKPEVARVRQQAAKQTIGKFRGRQRLRVLSHLYETLTS